MSKSNDDQIKANNARMAEIRREIARAGNRLAALADGVDPNLADWAQGTADRARNNRTTGK